MVQPVKISGVGTRVAILVGQNAAGEYIPARLTNEGYLIDKLMALDTQTVPNADVQVACDAQGRLKSSGTVVAHIDELEDELKTLNSLIPSLYDYIALSYTGSNLTQVVFKLGGSGGSTVSTLTLAYTGARLDTVTKS